tara:strand:- start:2125 stop:2373 length:249 start_codon:yes stop_codon:yes gene_type:complete
MDFEKEYEELHFNESQIENPIFYIGFRVKRALNLIVTDREVRQFGATKNIEDIKSIWEVETFTESSDFYKRIQKFLPMVVTL